MEADNFKERRGTQYGDGILLDDFKGDFSLVAAKSKDGKIYMEWVFPQKKDGSKQPMDKSLPWKVTLGPKDEAVETLLFFLGKLGWEQADRGPEGTNPGDIAEDGEPIPF
jgi:hypothetical protein